MDLFPLEESLSPRLKWMRENKVISEPPSPQFDEWNVYSDNHPSNGNGEDEESALIDFAMKNNLKMWN